MSKSQAENGPPLPNPVQDTTPEPAPEPTGQPAVTRSGRGVAGFALLLAAAALALSGWLWWQDMQLEQPVSEPQLAPWRAELEDLRVELRENLERIERTGTEDLARLRAADAGLEQSLARRIEAEQALAAQLSELNRADRRLWQLAEAEYLMQLAQQRLQTGADAEAALQLLRQADSIMRARADADLYPVRAALAAEIAALEAVPALDIDGLYLRLEALADRAADLPLVPQPDWQPAADPVESPDTWQQQLRNGFAAAWHKLSGYIRIRQRDQPLEPLLEPPVERALRLNMELLGEQAQLALLADNAELFRHSLERSIEWLERYYRVDPAATAALVAAFRELMAAPVSVELPELGAARRALATYLDSRRPGNAADDGAAEEASR